MEQFGIQINDGSNIIPNFIVKQNEASVTLFDWQRRAIDYFFSHNNTAIFEVATGCLTKDTLIELPRNLDNYPNGIPIKELVGKENFYVYSFNIEKQQLELKKAKKVWMAGKNKDVYEITLFSGKKIRTTKNHPFLVDIKKKPEKGCGQGKREKIISRIYKNLEDLKIGDYLTTFNRATIRCTDGEQIKVNYNEKRILEHRFIAQQVFDKLKKHDIVHHIDENKYNNEIKNLQIMDSREHNSYHTLKNGFFGRKLWEQKGHPRGMKGKKQSIETINMISKNTKLTLNGFDYIKFRKKKYSEEFKKNGFESYKYKTNKKDSSLKCSNTLKLRGKEFLSARSKYGANTKYSEKIINIKYVGKEDVYDMEVEDNHNFIANNFIVHNSGKTFCAIEIIKRIWEKDSDVRVLIVVPKNIILEDTWYKELYNNGIGIKDIGAYYGKIKEYTKVTITNMQSLNKISLNIFDCVIFDECFEGNTKIITEKNKKIKIQKIKDIVDNKIQCNVLSYNIKKQIYEYKKIKNFYKIKEKREVLDIELEDGIILTVTPEQLIYTKNGYIEANKLKNGDIIYGKNKNL